MSTTLILGAGFGGIATARALRSLLDDRHRIVIVDRAERFHVGATKIWVMLGYAQRDEVERPIQSLLPAGVELVPAEVARIDPAAGEVATSRGTLRADFLVLALGAEYAMDGLPGLDAFDTFYSMDGAARLRPHIENFAGGHVLVLLTGKPYKCPPAPYEAAMLLHEYFRDRGIRDQARLSVYTFEGTPLGTAGPKMSAMMQELLEARDIELHTGHTPTAIDPEARSVAFDNGAEAGFDLLLPVPPHRVPQAVREAGLTDGSGWVPVDPRTLEVSRDGSTRLYAIGDVTKVPLPGRYREDMPLALPKAGVMAAAHGEVVARRIAAHAEGREPDATFDGHGFCFIETGRHEATRGGGDFFALPHPAVEPRQPSQDDHREKADWVREWLTPVRPA